MPEALPALDRAESLDPAVQLRERYRSYRARQARKLVGMLPREAVRPLLRRAIAAAEAERVAAPSIRLAAAGMDASAPLPTGCADPLEALVRYCERLLPLPPFEVWVEDVTVHAEAHLADLEDSAYAPTAAAPLTLDARPFEYRAEGWIAHLRGFRDGSAWRGYIAFEHRRTRRLQRTSLIFREHDPSELRARFSSFENAALEAFLRSTLPS